MSTIGALDGMKALVTGGATGIGRAIVERFVAEGASVVIAQRREPDPSLVAHPDIHHITADLSSTDSFTTLIDEATRLLGGLDVLVNNAGILFERDADVMTVEEWDRMMAINLRAPMFLTQAAIPHLRASSRAAVINLSSIEGIGANPQHTAYSASKSGIIGLTRALAVDLGRDGIRVNAIAPGWIETDMSRAYMEDSQDGAVRERLNALHPVGRTGSPEEIADAALFLAGGQSSFLTGQTIVVDGGRTIQLPLP